MPTLPTDHPERIALADEAHSRPPESLDTPVRATYIALLVDADNRERELAHLARLCAQRGVAPPPAGSTHFSASLGDLRVKWERHGEFSGYTFFAPGRSPQPFSEPVAMKLPPEWLASIPGQTIVAAHAKLVSAAAGLPDATALAAHFGGNIVVGSEIGDGAGLAYTDFKIHPDGFSRFLVIDRGLTPRQAGRTLQRLFEIEVVPDACACWRCRSRDSCLPSIVSIEGALADADRSASRTAQRNDDESLLHAADAARRRRSKAVWSSSQFRFSACRAYFELVTTRIGELREQRLPGIQTIEEFMARRFTPAVATCNDRVAAAARSVGARRADQWPCCRPASTSPASDRTRRCSRRWIGARSCSCACSRPWKVCRWRPSSITWRAWSAMWRKAVKVGRRCTIAPDLVVGLAIPVDRVGGVGDGAGEPSAPHRAGGVRPAACARAVREC